MAGKRKWAKINPTPEEAKQIFDRQPQKPTRGRGGNANFPNSFVEPSLPDGKMANYILTALTCYSQQKVSSDEELVQRIIDYFKYCALKDSRPTVEGMILCTGYSKTTISAWENGTRRGFSPETGEIIKRFKEMLAQIDAEMMLNGDEPVVGYIYRTKNYYGMTDQQTITVAPAKSLGDGLTEQEVAERLLQDSKNVVDIKPSDSGDK